MSNFSAIPFIAEYNNGSGKIDIVRPAVDSQHRLLAVGEFTGSVSIPPSTDFDTFEIDVDTTATLIDTSVLPNTFYIMVQGRLSNLKPVYVGKSGVSTSGANCGTEIGPGASITYPILDGGDGVYVIAEDNAQKAIITLFNGTI